MRYPVVFLFLTKLYSTENCVIQHCFALLRKQERLVCICNNEYMNEYTYTTHTNRHTHTDEDLVALHSYCERNKVD